MTADTTTAAAPIVPSVDGASRPEPAARSQLRAAPRPAAVRSVSPGVASPAPADLDTSAAAGIKAVQFSCARSSVVEHYLDTVRVGSSILSARTRFLVGEAGFSGSGWSCFLRAGCFGSSTSKGLLLFARRPAQARFSAERRAGDERAPPASCFRTRRRSSRGARRGSCRRPSRPPQRRRALRPRVRACRPLQPR